MTGVATLLPNGKQQFIDSSGVPLVGGFVYFYIPETTTPKTTWQDPTQTTPNTNPVILDSRGQAIIYGEGQYRQQVFDIDNNLVWDQLTASTDYGLLQAANNLSDVADAATALANLGGISATQLAALVPPGSVMAFAGIDVPDGWLNCDGSAVVRSTYDALFSAIGTTYGKGDGSTTFNLPELSGAFLRGYDSTGDIDPNDYSYPGTLTNGSATITAITPTGVTIGQTVTDADSFIPPATTVIAVTGTTVTLSAEATGDATGETISFSGRPFGSTQTSAFQVHGHSYTDPGHSHALTESGWGPNDAGAAAGSGGTFPMQTTSVEANGVSINVNGPNSGQSQANETRPLNVTMLYIIKT